MFGMVHFHNNLGLNVQRLNIEVREGG